MTETTPVYYDLTNGAPDHPRWTPDTGFTVYALIRRNAPFKPGQAIIAKGSPYDNSLAWVLRVAHGGPGLNVYEFGIWDEHQQGIARADSAPGKNAADAGHPIAIVGRWNGGVDAKEVDLVQSSKILNVFKGGIRIDAQAITHDVDWQGIWQGNGRDITIGRYSGEDLSPFSGQVLCARFYAGWLSDEDIGQLSTTGTVGLRSL